MSHDSYRASRYRLVDIDIYTVSLVESRVDLAIIQPAEADPPTFGEATHL